MWLMENNMVTLTVFTPAYNRAHTITRTYESMLRQDCKDFIWMVVDDGSTDNTAELIKEQGKDVLSHFTVANYAYFHRLRLLVSPAAADEFRLFQCISSLFSNAFCSAFLEVKKYLSSILSCGKVSAIC